MKSKLGAFKIVLTLAIVGAFVIYFASDPARFKPLLSVKYHYLVAILGFNLLAVAVNGLYMKLILKSFDKRIPLGESMYVSLIASVGNFFATAGAGFGFRGVYLKRQHNLAYSDYVSILSGNYILVFAANSLLGIIALIAIGSRAGTAYYTLLLVFLGVLFGSLLLAVLKMPAQWRKYVPSNALLKKIWWMIVRVSDGWQASVAKPKLLIQLLLLVFASFGITVLITATIVASLGLTISLPKLILFGAIGSLSLFLNFTPANLGIKEAIYLFSNSVIGFSTSQILLIALIDRGVLFFTLLLAWILSLRAKRYWLDKTN